jgi:hypothetical protein
VCHALGPTRPQKWGDVKDDMPDIVTPTHHPDPTRAPRLLALLDRVDRTRLCKVLQALKDIVIHGRHADLRLLSLCRWPWGRNEPLPLARRIPVIQVRSAGDRVSNSGSGPYRHSAQRSRPDTLVLLSQVAQVPRVARPYLQLLHNC